jgi:hypothetical protein
MAYVKKRKPIISHTVQVTMEPCTFNRYTRLRRRVRHIHILACGHMVIEGANCYGETRRRRKAMMCPFCEELNHGLRSQSSSKDNKRNRHVAHRSPDFCEEWEVSEDRDSEDQRSYTQP